MKNIFFEINFFSFLEILFIKQNVFLISDIKNLYINMVKKFCKKKFHIIDVYTSDIKIKNENVYFVSEKLATKYKDPLDKYFKKNIEFKNLKEAIERIMIYKKNLSKNKYDDLGNWNFIIKKILKLKNKQFVKSIQKILY